MAYKRTQVLPGKESGQKILVHNAAESAQRGSRWKQPGIKPREMDSLFNWITSRMKTTELHGQRKRWNYQLDLPNNTETQLDNRTNQNF